MARLTRGLVAAGSLLAVAGTAHACVNALLLRRPPAAPRTTSRRVSVLIPARDEAGRIRGCLDAVLAQRGVPDLEVLVLDDGSADGTGAIVASYADPRLHLLTGAGDPPPGWLGKPWACARLAEAATGQVLVFVDADVLLTPDAVAATVALMRDAALDLACPYPRQLADGLLPRLVQPLLQWSFLTTLPLRPAEHSPRPSLTAANGQLLAVSRAAYDAAGGHAAVRGEVLDDLALARAVKRAGGRGGVVDGTRLATCRMYDDARALADGYAKSLWCAFASPAGGLAVCAGLVLAYVVPPVAALRGNRIGLAGWAAGVAGRVVTARRTGGRAWPDALAHPLSVLALSVLTARSVVLHRRGALTWKNRPLP